MSAPTIEEERLINELRARLKDVLETENQKKSSFLIRWLRARDHDLNKAEEMLRSSLTWRKTNGINNILDVPLDNFFQHEFPYYIKGVDKCGRPVVVTPMGNYDFRKMAAEKTTQEINHFVGYCFEDCCRAIENINQGRDPNLYPVTQFTLIVDWKGYSYMQFCSLSAIQHMLRATVLLETHYPESGFQCLAINCPGFFNLLMMLGKQVMSPKTYNKIKVYGGRDEWEPVCREIIDEDQLSEIFKLIS